MSQLTANIVYATYRALDETQREAFMQLIDGEKEKHLTKKPKPKSKYNNPEFIESMANSLLNS